MKQLWKRQACNKKKTLQCYVIRKDFYMMAAVVSIEVIKLKHENIVISGSNSFQIK